MSADRFSEMLTGGHPNSLGRTEEVVSQVLRDKARLSELYDCYFEDDEVVRLRTSSAFKRIAKQQPDWLVSYVDRFTSDVAEIDQASKQWTLAQLFGLLVTQMTPTQRAAAVKVMQRNLERSQDWIVLNLTMQTLAVWATTDTRQAQWLVPQLKKLSSDSRKSVAKRARKLLARLA